MESTINTIDKPAVLAGLIKLMRPSQWVKNGFVLAPLVFTAEFVNLASVADAMLAAVLFSLAASAAYIVNDYHDMERDRLHPVKRQQRPLASGDVTTTQALILLTMLYTVLAFAYLVQPAVMQVIVGYLALNLAYTFKLKSMPVLDIFTIASGFVLRVYAGAVALAVPLSSWMFVTTLCLALYLAAIKRRQELANTGEAGREVLAHYSVDLVNRYAEMAATGALLFYSLYVMNTQPKMIITIPLVLYGLFRYWYVVETLDGGESPTDALFSDWQLPVTVLLWVGVCVWVLWPAGV